jgi:bifunctional non-homologous end joining protein LigD
LNPQQRRGAIERLTRETFDIAIIGGGVTGCGAALDAVSRGFSVALIEQRDIASGTSSRSSKLIHGGLRYLEQLHFGLVREARHEQALLLTRFPDGIDGKSFYQKNAPEFVPEWIRRVRVWSDSSEREIEYFVCDNEESLLYIANMGAIPLHVWPSRVQSLQHPDWCILDLDPKTAPFAHVVTLARAIRALCEDIGLPSFVKTTGSTGLHVLIPLGGQCTFDQSRQLGQLIARHIESQHGPIATTLRNPALRAGRVYLDYLQNRHGQLLVAPYSLRPLPGAPASAPLTWKEVDDQLGPRQFTLRNLPARLARQRRDPLLPVLDAKPNLVAALAVLAQRLDDRGKDRA